MNNFHDLTADLTVAQLQDLLQYLWTVQRGVVSRASVKAFRRDRGLAKAA